MVCEVAFGLLECVMLRLEKTIRTNFKCSSKYGANETYAYIVPINLLEQVVFHRNSVKENYIRISKLLKVSFSF